MQFLSSPFLYQNEKTKREDMKVVGEEEGGESRRESEESWKDMTSQMEKTEEEE